MVDHLQAPHYGPQLPETAPTECAVGLAHGPTMVANAHQRLCRAYRLLAGLIRKDHLFTCLVTGCPKIRSRLGGGICHPSKQALQLHRGVTATHQMRAAEWVLIERGGLRNTAHSYITDDAFTPQRKRRPSFTRVRRRLVRSRHRPCHSQGLWLRSGWAGGW